MQGARLRVVAGAQLRAESLVVQQGGSLVVDGEGARLLLGELVLEHGEQLSLVRGAIEVGGGRVLVREGDLTIGAGTGAASLRLIDGARVEVVGGVVLGQEAGASGTLEVSGRETQLRVREAVVAGLAGDGLMSVSGGAAMHAAMLRIGVESAASGVVQVHDEATQLRIDGPVAIGERGAGRFELDERAKLEAGGLELGERGEIREAGSVLPVQE